MAYEAWIGREEERSERILASVVASMAATLDLERAPQAGEALPPGWQWLFFNPVERRSALGTDGHPRLGGFLPPIESARRMWAGSRTSLSGRCTDRGAGDAAQPDPEDREQDRSDAAHCGS